MRRLTRLILAVAVFVGLMPVVGTPAAAEEGTHSDNMSLVANISYAARHGAPKNQGTDLEFVELTLTDAAKDRLKQQQPRAVDANTKLKGLQRRYSVAGSYDNGMHLIDITEPTKAFVAGVYDCGISQGDVQVFTRGTRTYATYTWDDGYDGAAASACFTEAKALGFTPSEGTFIADITNPYAPTTVSFVPFPKGSHNQTVHPSGNYLYNSNSDLIYSALGAGIEVYDISNLAAPKQAAFLALPVRPGLGTESHDITFNTAGTRAYSAALSQGVIIDTTNPAAPEIVTSFVDPSINVWHQSDPVTITDPILGKRDFLIVEDEFVGALGTAQCPNGGVHVFDVTGPLELNPVKVGYWNIDEARVFDYDLGCTAHVFDIHESEALMTIAYYQGGVRVVDLSGLVGVALGTTGVGMKELGYYYFADDPAKLGVDPGASNTWAFKAPFVDRDGVFYAYGNDQNRGFDIYKVDLSSAAGRSSNDGTWLTAAEVLALAEATPDAPLNKPYCLLGER